MQVFRAFLRGANLVQTGGVPNGWLCPALPIELPGMNRRELRAGARTKRPTTRTAPTPAPPSRLPRQQASSAERNHWHRPNPAAFDLRGSVRLLLASMDRLTPERRSWNMARIRGHDTSPERIVRTLLHRLGFRFRLHCKQLPGRPDIVLPKHRKVVLVHGCYWHRHEGCKYAYSPKSRVEFWTQKFERNVARDREVLTLLEDAGWTCIVVWECETRDIEALTTRLQAFLNSQERDYNAGVL